MPGHTRVRGGLGRVTGWKRVSYVRDMCSCVLVCGCAVALGVVRWRFFGRDGFRKLGLKPILSSAPAPPLPAFCRATTQAGPGPSPKLARKPTPTNLVSTITGGRRAHRTTPPVQDHRTAPGGDVLSLPVFVVFRTFSVLATHTRPPPCPASPSWWSCAPSRRSLSGPLRGPRSSATA